MGQLGAEALQVWESLTCLYSICSPGSPPREPGLVGLGRGLAPG